MNTLETKMAAVLRFLVAEDDAEYQEAKKEIRRLMEDREPVVKQEDPEAVVRRLLLEIGAPDHLMGHQYTIRAILLVMEDWRYINKITQYLYPLIAQEFSTTAFRVERAIRHLIEVAWNRGDVDVLDRYFGNTVSPEKGKPTNGEFIARLANVVKLRMKQ